jgi:hypothetical protein
VELPPLVSQLEVVSVLINTYAFETVESTRGASYIPPTLDAEIEPEVVSVPAVPQTVLFMPVTAQTECNGEAVAVSPTKTNPVEVS